MRQGRSSPEANPAQRATVWLAFQKTYTLLLLVLAVGSWWIVLGVESRQVAQEESEWLPLARDRSNTALSAFAAGAGPPANRIAARRKV